MTSIQYIHLEFVKYSTSSSSIFCGIRVLMTMIKKFYNLCNTCATVVAVHFGSYGYMGAAAIGSCHLAMGIHA